jgi:ABC-type amino acid transport substrate-binding protein
LQALQRGEIDILGGGTPSEARLAGLQLTHPYLADQPVLVSRIDAPSTRRPREPEWQSTRDICRLHRRPRCIPTAVC